MKYMGSKARIAKAILPIILADRQPNQPLFDLFCGGCNLIDKVTGVRFANDTNEYLIAMWEKIVRENWTPPKHITRNEYTAIRENKTAYPKALVGWVGVACSYSGKWFGGYAGKVKTKVNTIRDYQAEAHKNLLKQKAHLNGVVFTALDYQAVILGDTPAKIYCDPPYANTTDYKTGFDHERFWVWATETSKQHEVFVSEYNAPEGWLPVWSKPVKSSLSANGKSGGSKNSIEKLFVYKG